ncbi:MAG: Penicillin-binding protein, partial [Tardiphaga sp.]|nr:Penicillin-binding protein [Tardiphaga sp.]
MAAGAVALVAAGVIGWATSLGPLPLDAARHVSQSVVDRHGKLLRAYAMPDGRWRLPVAAATQLDPGYRDLLLAYEDRRFLTHWGVDPWALGRAAFQLISQGRIVSGGSTITMQVARLIEPRRERSVTAKLRQIVRALQLERQFTKAEILDLYLALAPFGGNLEGVRAAAIAYFGKEPRRLSLAESALLVALPQSPESRRLDRHPDAGRIARDRVLDRMMSEHRVSADDAAQARLADVPTLRRPMPVLAPHAADQAVAAHKDKTIIQLTLDAALQRNLEALARDRAAALGSDISIGIIAVDHASGEVLARVGSPDYFDDRRAGQVDMTRAIRSPGSTLKPFIYGLAFEDGFVHPDSLIDDRPIRFGGWAPDNFDMTFQGTVPVRRALQLSLNVPAIALLDRVGAQRLASRLRQAGARLVLPKDEAPGLAMGLGGVGISLQDLAQLYAGIARGGAALPLQDFAGEAPREALRLLDDVA